MKKLYDEIMALSINSESRIDYYDWYDDALKLAAELAKKYDDEIERLHDLLKMMIAIIKTDDD